MAQYIFIFWHGGQAGLKLKDLEWSLYSSSCSGGSCSSVPLPWLEYCMFKCMWAPGHLPVVGWSDQDVKLTVSVSQHLCLTLRWVTKRSFCIPNITLTKTVQKKTVKMSVTCPTQPSVPLVTFWYLCRAPQCVWVCAHSCDSACCERCFYFSRRNRAKLTGF